MICHEYRTVFVHVPKTAGRSIEHVFLELVGLTWETRAPLLLRANDDPCLGPPRLAHLTASEYVSLGHISQEEFDAYFKFAFVRNPWTRLVSEYKFRGWHKVFSFRDFIFKHFPQPSWSAMYNHVKPQYEFLFDEHGNQLVDFIGKYENLQADFDRVCQLLGLEPPKLPHVGQSDRRKWWYPIKHPLEFWRMRRNTHPNYTCYYDARAIEFVSQMYHKDIETFGYRFGE